MPVKFKEEQIIEINYTDDGYTFDTIAEEIKKAIEFLYNANTIDGKGVKGQTIEDKNLLDTLKVAFSILEINDGKETYKSNIIGNTYKVVLNFESSNFELDETQRDSFYLLLKYKTVSYNEELYTIEDALNIANSGTITVKSDTKFTSLTDSIIGDKYPNNSLYNDGSYRTIKNDVTLLLPYDKQSGLNSTNTATTSSFGKNKQLELIIAENIILINNGTISIGGITTGQQGGFSGATSGDYAQITLERNAKIESNGGINAYGFIVEKEENNDSEVIMNTGTLIMPFIVREHRGGTQFLDMIGGSHYVSEPDLKTSPFNTFFMENVRSKLVLTSNAILKGHANLFASGDDHTTDIELIGNSIESLIKLSEKTKLIAKFDSNSGVTHLEIKGSATINSLSLKLMILFSSFSLSTKTVHFPISWRYDVLLSPFEDGSNAIVDTKNQKMKLLPGAKLTVSSGVTLNASELVVYDENAISKITDPSQNYEHKNEKAILIVNGTLIADKLAGTVLTTADNARLEVKDNYIETKELEVNTPYSQTDVLFSGKGHGSTYIDVKTTLKGHTSAGENQEMVAGTYTSKDGIWSLAS